MGVGEWTQSPTGFGVFRIHSAEDVDESVALCAICNTPITLVADEWIHEIGFWSRGCCAVAVP